MHGGIRFSIHYGCCENWPLFPEDGSPEIIIDQIIKHWEVQMELDKGFVYFVEHLVFFQILYSESLDWH